MNTQRIDQLLNDMPMHGRIEAIFKATTSLRDAARSIVNVVVPISNKTDFEQATAALYFRMFGWIDSLTRLNLYIDVQAACAVTRSMYELWIDILDLTNDPTLLEKFNDFNFVEKYRAAKVYVETLDASGTDKNIGKPQRAFMDEPGHKQKFDTLRAKHWINKKGQPYVPSNWSGRKLDQRTRTLGSQEEIRYRNLYPMFSWYTHSGVVGIYGVSEEGYLSAFGMAQLHAQKIFQEASLLIGDQFQVFAVPELKQRIEEYGNVALREMANYVATALNEE